MAEESWYYADGNNQLGPISRTRLDELISLGQVHDQTLVWREGLANWTSAASVPGLMPDVALAPVDAASEQSPRYASPLASAPLNYYSATPNAVVYAGFWMRFAAYLIDYIITFVGALIVGGVLGFVIGIAMATSGHAKGTVAVAQGLGNLLGIVLGWLYWTLMESSSLQATVGKMALGLKVTDEVGERISFGRATGRYFGKIISGIILCIGFMMAGWTERKQGLHDMMASTLVVRK